MGVSKHYILRGVDGGYWIDYAIPRKLAGLVVGYKPWGEQEAYQRRVDAILAMDGGWRKKINALLPLRTQLLKREYILSEYKVYPGRKPSRCAFRNIVRGVRKFVPKNPKEPKVTRQVFFHRPAPIPAPPDNQPVFRLPDFLQAAPRVQRNAPAVQAVRPEPAFLDWANGVPEVEG